MSGASTKLKGATITLAHGSGGKAMRQLIDSVLLKTFYNPHLSALEDQARFDLQALGAHGDSLAFTTDSFVVDPLFFPGGDIGKLAVYGTVNDLAVGGAKPLYLSCGLILEEGLPIQTLEAVAMSMRQAADEVGVTIVTGDTKVVQRGAADKMFINTAGVGVIPEGISMSADRAEVGDVVICNGYIGDHGAAIVDARGELAIENTIQSDCQSLSELSRAMLSVCPNVRSMRDATRGGIATVANEFAQASRCCIRLVEEQMPVRPEVRGMCEILGLDPLYLANEGKLVAIVPAADADAVLAAMRAVPAGEHSCVVGYVEAAPQERVILNTMFGSERIVDMLIGEQLPRIC